MRKNIKAVIQAFQEKRTHNEKTCHTDGERVYSYAMLIAERLPDGTVAVVDYDKGPSATTRSQIRALQVTFPNAPTLDAKVPYGIITGNATMGTYGRY